jgi:hypothetical protein
MEIMTVLGQPLSCTRSNGHLGQHHDASTGAFWYPGRQPRWREFWRRQRGANGALVEGVMWITVALAALRLLSHVLGWLT